MMQPAAQHAMRRTVSRGGLVLIGALIALVVAGGTLSACGQKGNLYLPSQKKSKVPPSSSSAPPASTAPIATPGDGAASGPH
jgi:predicted small lipoprotein YifL